MELAYATTTPEGSEDSRVVEGTLDHLSDYWGHLPADVKSHILTFVRHPVAALVPRNNRWVYYQGRRIYVDRHPILDDFAENYQQCQHAFTMNETWRHFDLCEQWDQRMDLVEQDDLTGLTEDELDVLEGQARQIHEWQDRLNRITLLMRNYFLTEDPQ